MADGAMEIDIVINREMALMGNWHGEEILFVLTKWQKLGKYPVNLFAFDFVWWIFNQQLSALHHTMNPLKTGISML